MKAFFNVPIILPVRKARRACPVLTGCLPAGRKGRGASQLNMNLLVKFPPETLKANKTGKLECIRGSTYFLSLTA